MHSSLIVTSTQGADPHAAAALAHELGLAFTPAYEDRCVREHEYALVLTPAYLGVQDTTAKKFLPFYIDFTSGKMRYRSDHAGLKRELLARALGMKPAEQPRIIDATAGLGRDSFILATLGYNITLLERSPVVFALLRDAMQRAATDPAIQRMTLIHADATNWLKTLTPENQPDIIYLDPMFPARDKSASVKKEMVILQHLLGKQTDADDLLTRAIACSNRRVVVKRPRLAPALAGLTPGYTLTGKSSRFDIYLV